MFAFRACQGVVVSALVLAAGLLAGEESPAERVSSAGLGGDERYLTALSTDKPIYRGREKVYVRGVILHAADRTPLKDAGQPRAMVEIRGPKGDVVASAWTQVTDSVLGYAWDVPAEQPGGQYTVKVRYPFEGFAPAERKFDVRAYRAPRLKSQIVFLRDGYGPGDEVAASLHTERAEGGIPAGAKVSAVARVDAAEVANQAASIDAKGNCEVRFRLPEQIARGEGTLAFVIEDGGAVETAAKTIPILLQTVDLAVYPEGGDLVAGLPARVYLQARTPAQKPADIAGVVVSEAGDEVARFRTAHEGRGRFEFTPKAKGKYLLKITEPAGIKTTYPLPEVKSTGGVIQAAEDRTLRGEPVRLKVGSAKAGKLTVTLTRRENEVASLKLGMAGGEVKEISLTPPQSADGVLIATVWDEGGRPLAERLIYRQPASGLRVTVKPESTTYVPGDPVNVTVETTDESGRPVGAVVGLTVTDDSILEMIEKREQAPRLPVMVLLENDVRELADAHVYLDETNPTAAQAVDLLLGTQGWRRFAFIHTETFLKEHSDAARRVLGLRTPARPASHPANHLWFGMAGGGAGGVNVDDFSEVEGAVVLNGRGMKDVPQPAVVANAGVVPMEALDLKAAARPASPPPIDQRLQEVASKEDISPLLADRNVLFGRDEGQMGAARAAEGRLRRIMPMNLVAVRVYAHESRPNRQPGERVDFTETLYWNAGIKTDETTGQAKVSFALNDAVTTFRIFADAFSAAGALGEATGAVESVQPFYIEPKLPLEVTTGDRIQLPVGVVSGMSHELAQVRLSMQTGGGIDFTCPEVFALEGKGRARRLIDVRIGKSVGAVEWVVHGQAGPLADSVTRPLRIKPLGFPVEVAFGGMLETDSAARHALSIPESLVAGSMTTKVAVFPTPLANMTAALERLIQEPNGCFEQTSSTVYPMVMAQQYFLSHTGVEPALIERSRALLDKGYAKLTSFECKQRGYEWFGGDPGHEALTAYGLLEFSDMAQVRDVDRDMATRTREWLLKRRDGKGGFLRDAKALDSFGGAPEPTTNAYIVWALASAGEKGLQPETAALKKAAASAEDTYVVALAANVAALDGQGGEAKKFMDALVKKQTKEGWVDGAATSITRSGGDALKIETTSLAVLAWLRDPAYAAAVENGIRYLAESCKAGRFGSTQSTVLALRAIVEYDRLRAKPKAPGSVQVFVDGEPVGKAVSFDAQTQGAIELADITKQLTPGRHAVELRMTDGSSMPYALAVNYHDTQPASSKECKVGLSVTMTDQTVAEGAITEAGVVVTNQGNDALPTPVAIVGLPGGLEPRHDQLKELVKSGKVDAYEVIGRDVVFYWRQLKAGQQVRFPISLVAAIPGTYTGPASRAYLYYTDEFKTWIPGATITITPRAEG